MICPGCEETRTRKSSGAVKAPPLRGRQSGPSGRARRQAEEQAGTQPLHYAIGFGMVGTFLALNYGLKWSFWKAHLVSFGIWVGIFLVVTLIMQAGKRS